MHGTSKSVCVIHFVKYFLLYRYFIVDFPKWLLERRERRGEGLFRQETPLSIPHFERHGKKTPMVDRTPFYDHYSQNGSLKLQVLQCIKLSMVHVFIWGKITFKCLTPLSKEQYYFTRIKTIEEFYYRYVCGSC